VPNGWPADGLKPAAGSGLAKNDPSASDAGPQADLDGGGVLLPADASDARLAFHLREGAYDTD
jgi:hypothetical protein